MRQRSKIESILHDAVEKSHRLSKWENDFIDSMIRLGDHVVLTEAQDAKLSQIEDKIYAAG